jgi:hypothetical protein
VYWGRLASELLKDQVASCAYFRSGERYSCLYRGAFSTIESEHEFNCSSRLVACLDRKRCSWTGPLLGLEEHWRVNQQCVRVRGSVLL